MKHITHRTEDKGHSLTCEHCGDQHALRDPKGELPAWILAALIRGFSKAHGRCRKRKAGPPPAISHTTYTRQA